MLKMTDENFDVQAELEETQRALREITLMTEQSQGELSKLAQRNAAITAHLQQIQSQVEKTSVQDIRMAYDSALDAQQRLFVMRGQLEKLQSDKNHLEKYKAALNRVVSRTAADGAATSNAEKASSSGMEMIINAQEAERQRLSRQMHDGPAQAMSNFILQTEIAMRLLDVDAAQAKEELGNLKAAAMSTFQKVRNFIFELRPMMLDDLGLAPTLRKYVEAFKDQTGLDTDLVINGGDRRIAPYLEVMIFRAVQELLGNTARHSQATLVKISLEMGSDVIRVSVDDNGKGFDPEAVLKGNSLGLKLIRERTEMLRGTFNADSAVGKGSRIAFSIPIRT